MASSTVFQSTLPLRGATKRVWASNNLEIFQSTLPLRGATLDLTLASAGVDISIHTPLAGSDRPYTSSPKYSLLFQSTLPLRGATAEQLLRLQTNSFQSTLPLRGATRVHVRDAVLDLDVISIHTPLAGSDFDHRFRCFRTCAISIHTPLAGSDQNLVTSVIAAAKFQSTLPLRGATFAALAAFRQNQFQSTLPLRGATFAALAAFRQNQFQSTLPLRGATWSVPCRPSSWCNFNPHSPCGERPCANRSMVSPTHFNPHSPCGERLRV